MIIYDGNVDLLRAYLQNETGVSGATVDQLRAFLYAETGVSGNTIDQLRAWLTAQGFEGGTDDMLRAWLASQGYTGNTIDMINASASDGVLLAAAAYIPLLTSLGTGSTFVGGGQTVEQYDGSLVTVDADVSAHSGMRWTGTAFVNDDGSGYLCHPVDSNGLSLTYDERVDSTAYAIGDKAYSGRFALACTADGTSHTSAPAITSTDLGSTVVDGGVTWSVDSWYQVSRGYLGEEARTNTLLYGNNFNLVWSKSKGGTGLAPVITAGYADSPVGASTATRIQFDRGVGTTAGDYSYTRQEVTTVNPHSESMYCWARSTDGASTYDMRFGNAAGGTSEIITITGDWTLFEVNDPIVASTSAFFYLILFGNEPVSQTADILVAGAQLELSPFSTSYIYTVGSQVTRPKTVASLPTANVLPANNFGARIAVEPLAAGLTGWAFNSYTDADNELGVLVEPTTVTLRKRIGGVDYDAAVSYTHAADTQMEVDLYLTTSEMGCRVREIGGAWSLWTTTANGTDAVIADTYQIGSRNDLDHLNGHFRDVQIYKTSNPKSKLESI